MAQNIDLSDYAPHPQARSSSSTTSTMKLPLPEEFFALPLPYHPDHNTIRVNLEIIMSECRIDISRLLRLFRNPARGAAIDLLFRVENQGLDPGYLVQAASTLVSPSSRLAKPVFSQLPSRVVSTASFDSRMSRYSGATLVASDTPTSAKTLEGWQSVPLTSDLALPVSSHPTHLVQSNHRQQFPDNHNHAYKFIDDPSPYNNFMLYNDSPHDDGPTPTITEHIEPDYETQHQNFSGTFWLTESEDLQPESAVVLPEQHAHDTLPTSLTPSYSSYLSPLEELTPTSSYPTPQSSNAGLPQNTDSARRSSCVKLPVRTSTPSVPATRNPEFQPYDPNVLNTSVNEGGQSPCPQCKKNFLVASEFIFHTEAEHDQPITYKCMHVDSEMRRCRFKTTRKATMTRHHSDHHKECNMPDACRSVTVKPHPKRNWGCSWCPYHSTDLKSWAEHHMDRKIETHRNCRRAHFNLTMLINSLLLQEATGFWWKQELQNLRNATGYDYEITWSDKPEVRRLITALETGWYQDKDLDQDGSLQQYLVKELMDQADKAPSHPVAASNKRAATSSPQGSKAAESRPRTDFQPLPSRSASNRTVVPGYNNAMQQEFDKGNSFYQRDVQR